MLSSQKKVAQTIVNPEPRISKKKFRRLEKGKVNEILLTRLHGLIPRTRTIADAYKGLPSKLRRLGATLTITSRKKGGKPNDNLRQKSHM